MASGGTSCLVGCSLLPAGGKSEVSDELVWEGRAKFCLGMYGRRVLGIMYFGWT